MQRLNSTPTVFVDVNIVSRNSCDVGPIDDLFEFANYF